MPIRKFSVVLVCRDPIGARRTSPARTRSASPQRSRTASIAIAPPSGVDIFAPSAPTQAKTQVEAPRQARVYLRNESRRDSQEVYRVLRTQRTHRASEFFGGASR